MNLPLVCVPWNRPLPSRPPEPMAIRAWLQLVADALRVDATGRRRRRSGPSGTAAAHPHARCRPRRGCRSAPARAASVAGISDTARTPMTMASTTIVVPTSGCSMIRPTGTAATASAVDDEPERRPVLGVRALREDHRQADAQRDLRELRRLHREACRQQDPRVRAVDARAERRQHREQAEHRRDVDERRVRTQHPVVEQRRRTQPRQTPIAMLRMCFFSSLIGSSPASASLTRVAE